MSAQSIGDDQLNEYLIDHCYKQMLSAETTKQQQFWYQRMARYVAQRSPERIQEMEVERGLA